MQQYEALLEHIKEDLWTKEPLAMALLLTLSKEFPELDLTRKTKAQYEQLIESWLNIRAKNAACELDESIDWMD